MNYYFAFLRIILIAVFYVVTASDGFSNEFNEYTNQLLELQPHSADVAGTSRTSLCAYCVNVDGSMYSNDVFDLEIKKSQ